MKFRAWLCIGLFFLSTPIWAQLSLLSDDTIEFSEDDYARRIYSYDFVIDSTGKIHILYGRPELAGENRTQIIYATKQVGSSFDATTKVILEEYGDMGSISNNILLGSDGTIHVSYLVKRDFTIVKADGGTESPETGLVYQTIVDGTASEKSNVGGGSFHTRMQLDTDGQIIFVRERELFENNTQPYPRALAFYKLQNGFWTETKVLSTETLATQSGLQEFRLGDFVIDLQTGRYHLSYGDKDADALRTQYPTSNPGQTPVNFPAGVGHNLMYAYSNDQAETWTTKVFDSSGTLSENEFWADLQINPDGNPVVGMYHYATDASGIHNDTSNVIGTLELSAGFWNTHAVAGTSPSTTSHRAGSALGLAIDDAGGLHGVWDNSPDQPIDAHAAQVQYGGTMYRYSPDGNNWDVRQPIFNFSVEGKVRTKIFNNRLFVMFLGDHRQVRLLLAEFQLPSSTDNLFEVLTNKSIYNNGENIDFYARLQGDTYGDYYVAIDGPYDCDTSVSPEQGCTPVTNGNYKLYYLDANQQWQTASSVADMQPALTVEGVAQPQAQSCSSDTQCNFSIPMNKTGFYIASVSLPDGETEGVWGLSAATGSGGSGYSTGGLLYSDYVGFTTFTLTQAESMTITAYEYINNGTVNVQIFDANRETVYGPVETQSGTTLTIPTLPAGFYISQVSSATTGQFGIALNGQSFAANMDAGGWIDSATTGFIAFPVNQIQTISLSTLFGQSYGSGGASKIEVDVYYSEADGSRSLYWSSDLDKFATISTTTVTGREQFQNTLFYGRPFDRIQAMQATPFLNPSSYWVSAIRTAPNGGSVLATNVSPLYRYILHVNP